MHGLVARDTELQFPIASSENGILRPRRSSHCKPCCSDHTVVSGRYRVLSTVLQAA